MMFKLSGCVFVIFFCTLTGMKKGNEYVIRGELLLEIISFLNNIKNNIKYKKDTKQYILTQAFINNNYKYFTLKPPACKTVQFESELNFAINNFYKENNNYILKNEFEILKNQLINLGSGNSNEEEQKLLYTIEYFNESAHFAKIKAKEQSKLYKTLGFCAGAAIALMLL